MKAIGFIYVILFSQILFAQPTTLKSKTNPDISLNALFLGQWGSGGSDETAEHPNNFGLQEAEIRMSSNIDAYFRGDAILAVEKDETTGEFIIEPEEFFIETISIPALTIKVGKFYLPIGRHNLLHTHAYPFINQPLINEELFGHEGLNESGISFAYLAPTPWFLEFTLQGVQADNEIQFDSDIAGDGAAVLAIKNLWELSDSSTLEFDLAHAKGDNQFDGSTKLYSGTLIYKWRPITNSKSTSFTWFTEYLRTERENATTKNDLGGFTSWMKYQFQTRWWAQVRGDYVGHPKFDNDITRRASVLFGFVSSEFSSIRLQYEEHNEYNIEENEKLVLLQFNLSLGTHPAHSY